MTRFSKYTRRKKANHANSHIAQSGGIPIFAGAQGCVFKPSLKCKHVPRSQHDDNVSKLEQKESAEAEMREYDQIRQHLKKIKNHEKYFSLQAHLCEPAPLEPHDLVNFDDVCTNLKRFNISGANVNANLSKLRMINMPDLGIDLKKWMDQTVFNAAHVRQLNDHISTLLVHAVEPMNRLGVIHNDLKSENVMIDLNRNVRIIDWGLSGITTPSQIIPLHHFMNNPVTFNRPFSTMIISPKTCELYSLKNKENMGELTSDQLKHFTRSVYKECIDAYDINGHKYLQYVIKSIFGSDDANEMLMDTVATYNSDILHHFTDRVNRKFRLNEYFSTVYRYNTDVWGLMSVFYSMFMLPRKSFVMSDSVYAEMLNRYRTLFRTVVFANGHKRMNVAHIVRQLQQISHATRIGSQKKTVRFNVNHNRLRNSIKRVPTPYPHVQITLQ